MLRQTNQLHATCSSGTGWSGLHLFIAGAFRIDSGHFEYRAEAEAFGYILSAFHVGVIMGSTVFGVVADIIDLSGAVLAWGITSLALTLVGLLIRERRSMPIEAGLPREAAQSAVRS